MATYTSTLPTLMNEHEAARILNIKPATLRHWRWRGAGPNYRKIGGNVRYHPDDVAAYIAECQRKNTSQADAAPVALTRENSDE